jgi:hypothetical protein
MNVSQKFLSFAGFVSTGDGGCASDAAVSDGNDMVALGKVLVDPRSRTLELTEYRLGNSAWQVMAERGKSASNMLSVVHLKSFSRG